MKYCEEIGIEAGAASRLFVYYGIASCVGRLVSGRLCDFEKVNTFYVYQTAELVTGASIIIVTMATSYGHVVVFIAIYGFCDGAFITTLNVLLLTCVSPPKIPVAISWEMQISSFFLVSGPPIAGMLSHIGKGGEFLKKMWCCVSGSDKAVWVLSTELITQISHRKGFQSRRFKR